MTAKYSEEQWSELCSRVKSLVPEAIGQEAWYLIIAGILTSSPSPELLAPFCTHLVTHESSFKDHHERERLSLRIRDVLIKLTTIIGAPRVLSALIPLASAQSNGDPTALAANSKFSAKWESANFKIDSITKRGEGTIDSIYGPLLPKIFDMFGPHKEDFKFYETSLVYGLYLSDFEHLTALETEVVVFTSILATGLQGPSLWHTRGLGRLLGARGTDESSSDFERIKDVIRNVKIAASTVVEFCGPEMEQWSNIQNWPNVGYVKRDLGGWGDDPWRTQKASS